MKVRLCYGKQSGRTLTQNTNQPLCSIRIAAPIKNCTYPNVTAILTILVTMPLSTATTERSFSTMWRVKIYKWSTMEEERLSGPSLLHAYRDGTLALTLHFIELVYYYLVYIRFTLKFPLVTISCYSTKP